MGDGVRAALAREIARALTLLRVEGSQSNDAYGRHIEDYLTSLGWTFAAPDDGMTAMEEGYARTVLGDKALTRVNPPLGTGSDESVRVYVRERRES